MVIFIKKIIEENRTGAEENEDIVSECSELPPVKDAIDRLNGETKTAVVLEKDSNNYMIVGGGNGGKYIVYAEVKGKMYIMSNKFPIPKGPIELTVGGKTSSYEVKHCMGLDMVLEAAKHYADRGALAQTFNWENRR